MKRQMALLLSGVLALSVLSGCKKDEAGQGTKPGKVCWYKELHVSFKR